MYRTKKKPMLNIHQESVLKKKMVCAFFQAPKRNIIIELLDKPLVHPCASKCCNFMVLKFQRSKRKRKKIFFQLQKYFHMLTNIVVY